MPKHCAYNLTRQDTKYRHDLFSAGLKAVGYEVQITPPGRAKPGDVLLIWNRYFGMHDMATRFEAGGGIVIIAENGYIKGPHDGGDFYALAIGGHNGSGRWPRGGPERFDALGIELNPWRSAGSHILVCPNRTFGMPGLAMPPEWPMQVCERLRKLTQREVRYRAHPGNDKPKRPLSADLQDCWAMVIWASSAGVHSLLAGIPVICESPWWICKAAAGAALHLEVETPFMPDRIPALRRLAWAQWTIEEISSGEPFRNLLRAAEQEQVAAGA